MLRWIKKHYIVSFIIFLILVLCALHFSGTRNEIRIFAETRDNSRERYYS